MFCKRERGFYNVIRLSQKSVVTSYLFPRKTLLWLRTDAIEQQIEKMVYKIGAGLAHEKMKS